VAGSNERLTRVPRIQFDHLPALAQQPVVLANLVRRDEEFLVVVGRHDGDQRTAELQHNPGKDLIRAGGERCPALNGRCESRQFTGYFGRDPAPVRASPPLMARDADPQITRSP